MKVTVCDNKVFVWGDAEVNEPLIIEKPEDIQIFVIGCNLNFKDSLIIRLTNWLFGSTAPTCGISVNSPEGYSE